MSTLSIASQSYLIEELASLTFTTSHGVEIEYERDPGGSVDTLADVLQSTGRFISGALEEKRKFIDNGYWSHLKDDSVDGGELVSPVFYHGLAYEEVSQMCQALHEAQAGVWSTNPGLHVHVSVEPLSELQDWVDLFSILVKFQDTFYKVAASPTRTHTGIHRSTAHAKHLPPLPRCDSLYSLLRAYYVKERAVSLHKVGDWNEGTIEFRLWDGTVDPELISLYIALSVRLVEKAGAGAFRNHQKMNFSDVISILFPDNEAIQKKLLVLSRQEGYASA